MKAYRKNQAKVIALRTTSAIAILVGIFATSTAHAQTSNQSAAAQPTSAATSPEAILVETVTVTAGQSIGGGNMIVQRQPETTNSVTAAAISEKASTIGPLQLIQNLPGVDTTQTDSFGMSQRSNLYLRGLPSTEQGWIVDGAPAVDQLFFLPYSEAWFDAENLAGLTVIPGSSRITDPVQTAIGGEIIATIRNPTDEFGSAGSVSIGSYDAKRVFARIDTGLIANTGFKAFASGSYTVAGGFGLPGTGNKTHADLKVQNDWTDNATSSLFVSFTNWQSDRPNVLTPAQFATELSTGNFNTFNPQATYAPFPQPAGSQPYWKIFRYERKTLMASWNNEFKLGDRLTLNIDPYFHWFGSNSPGQSSINPASIFNGNTQVTPNTTGLTLVNGLVQVAANSVANQHAAGITASGKYDVTDSNQLLVGWWHDNWGGTMVNSFSPLAQNGGAADNWGKSPLLTTAGQVIAGTNFRIHSDIDTFSIQDTQSFFDNRLKIEAGVKYYLERIDGNNQVPGPQTYYSQNISRALPRATISYDFNPNMQVYADVVTSIRPGITGNTYPNTYNVTTGKISQLGAPNTPPELSTGEEVGFRYHDDDLTVDLAGFNKLVRNRQVISALTVNGAGVSTTVNAGTESIQGFTAELASRPFFGITPYVNGQYLHAEVESNFLASNGDFLPTKGKTAIASPEFTANAGLNYNNGPFFGDVLFKYTSSQYPTLMNDAIQPGYHTIDIALGYHLPSFFGEESSTIKLNLTNVEDKPYLGQVAGSGGNAVATTGVNGTTIAPGVNPSYFIGAPFSAVVTLSTEF